MFVYFGLTINSVSVGSSKYTSFILGALIELPAYLATYFCMNKFGRKFPLCAALILSGVFCTSFAFIPAGKSEHRMFNYIKSICKTILQLLSETLHLPIEFQKTQNPSLPYVELLSGTLCPEKNLSQPSLSPRTLVSREYVTPISFLFFNFW